MTNGKILIIDDDPVMRELLKLYFVRNGFGVVLADEGVSALELIHREAPVAIITDVLMPGPRGLDLLRHLKSEPSTRHIPVFVVTSSDSPVLQQEAELVGAAGFFRKPFPPARLLTEIERVLPWNPAQ